MNKLQRFMLAIVLVVGAMLFLARPTQALIQSQRSQIGISIVVNVTPGPLSYETRTVGSSGVPIAAHFALRARGSQDAVDSVAIQGLTNMVAQAAAQHSLKVETKVTPNPAGTLLTSNFSSVAMSGTAGTTITQPCIFTVAVKTTVTAWTLREGLSADLTGGFPGKDIGNDSYLQGNTPQPTSTPFIVYPTAWTILASSGQSKTYCVDLTITIPPTLPGGTYSTNAIYTLYY